MNTSDSEAEVANAFTNYCYCNVASNVVLVLMFSRVQIQTIYKLK